MGSFFPAAAMAEEWRWLLTYNPVHHLIAGFRGGFVGGADGEADIHLLVGLLTVGTLGGLVHRALSSGWRLRQ